MLNVYSLLLSLFIWGFVLGKIDKGVNCSIVGCNNSAFRSLSYSEFSRVASRAGLSIGSNVPRRVYLCEDHYKVFKKFLRKEKMYEKWRYG